MKSRSTIIILFGLLLILISSFCQKKNKINYWPSNSLQLEVFENTKKDYLLSKESYLSKKKVSTDSTIYSFDTGHNITKVTTSLEKGIVNIIASSYEGVIMKIDYNGTIHWKKNIGKGIITHDLWSGDLNSDGNDEILIASGNGTISCMDQKGNLLWQFKPNDVPMISVCTIHNLDGSAYVACGGNDLNMYYISSSGKLLKTIPSSSYESLIQAGGKWYAGERVAKNVHSVNFLRPLPQPNGEDVLLMQGGFSHAKGASVLHQFKPMETKPFKSLKIHPKSSPIGDVRVVDIDKKGNYEVVIGNSDLLSGSCFVRYDNNKNTIERFDISTFKKIRNAYRVVQTETIFEGENYTYLSLVGSSILLIPSNLDTEKSEVITGKFAYNDMQKDNINNKLILGSAQSGGSCIHILNLNKANWKNAFKKLSPQGTIQKIVKNTANLHKQLIGFKKPVWERELVPTYLMQSARKSEKILAKYKNAIPIVLGGKHFKEMEDWDRSMLKNKTMENIRDNRKIYNVSQQDVIDRTIPHFNENGLYMWGGHGTDPFYYNPETLKKIIDKNKGKKTIFVWPELMILGKKDFHIAVDHVFTPLAKYAQGKNTNLYLRNKRNFWISDFYSPMWSRFLTGEFADVLVPSMEETEDQTMELSLTGRLGVWASGISDSWGSRCAMDNPSFMRTRQFSNQNLPNHFLRNAVYHAAYGAQYINNHNVPSKFSSYMDVFLDLLGSGALYIPKRSEIISFSPVHLGMKSPDKEFLDDGNSSTSTTKYEKKFHNENPFVFSRLSGGVWSGAEVTPWDFSRYAAKVIDRRQNMIAPYSDGMVLITPPQNGIFANTTAPRGKLIDNLHPLYKNIMKEYITDGRHYYSANGVQTLAADTYYKNIENDIKESAKKLPISISGKNVAWVAAQTSPKHIRLTLIDGGYINPNDRQAIVHFHTVKPKKMKDILDGKIFDLSKPTSVKVEIPCGLFRFIDIELTDNL